MAEQPHDFWNLDLSKLTWSGWLLMLLTIGTVIGILVAVIGVLDALGFRRDPVANRGDRWMGLVAFVPALAVGCGVFVGGRHLFERLGCPIQRRPQE
jgi:hypothetical protein